MVAVIVNTSFTIGDSNRTQAAHWPPSQSLLPHCASNVQAAPVLSPTQKRLPGQKFEQQAPLALQGMLLMPQQPQVPGFRV
jgi:hypothetical protein